MVGCGGTAVKHTVQGDQLCPPGQALIPASCVKNKTKIAQAPWGSGGQQCGGSLEGFRRGLIYMAK